MKLTLPTRSNLSSAFGFIFVLVAVAVALVALPSAAAAQDNMDILRGVVVGPDSQPVRNAQVTVTSMLSQTARTARTGDDGRFTILFASGGGDYLVQIVSLGMRPFETRVQRASDEAFLLVNALMAAAPQVLAGVTIQGNTGPPAGLGAQTNVGGSEQSVGSAGAAALSPAEAGELSALAATLPGVTLIPGVDGAPAGFSVLGLGADQNRVTLNGMEFDASDIPRGAAAITTLTTSSYDVARGGFSGAELSVSAMPASNFIRRSFQLSLDDPGLQWTDPAAARFGQEYRNAQLSGSFSGPLVADKAFYNASVQLGRRSSGLQSLLDADPVTLQRLGVAPDSMNRFLGVLNELGVPSTIGGVPGSQLNDNGSLLARLDLSPSGQKNLNFTASGSWRSSGGVSISPNTLPARGSERSNWNGALRGSFSTYFSSGFLNQTRVGANFSGSDGSPYLELPGGRVLVSSALPDGTTGVSTLSFGGSGSLGTTSRNESYQLTNETSWFTDDSRHRFKFSADMRLSRYRQDQSSNQLGSFSYNSLAELEAGLPTSYSRRLSDQLREGNSIDGSLSLGDAWRPFGRRQSLQVQYGIRLDANRYGAIPDYNPRVQELFGLRTDEAPNTISLSPRIGFSWSYGRATRLSGALNEGPRGTFSGGIGQFRNDLRSTLLAGAIDNTGLPDGARTINCVGPAVPDVDWESYLSDPSNLPGACADGTAGTVFSERSPSVTLFDPAFTAQRSWRANFGWTGRLSQRFRLRSEIVQSLNLSQSSELDQNFRGAQQFALADEGNRPVFVESSSIVPGSGAVASSDSRIYSEFTRVMLQRSDLRSRSTRLSLSLSPLTRSSKFNWNAGYIASWTESQERGFDGTTAGDPILAEWGQGSDSRHQVNLSASYTFRNAIDVQTYARVSSGSRYTPRVAGDVNGDGRNNDRAFIFDPASANDPAVASAMSTLLNESSGEVRACLERQLGQIAGRNSCTGRWTTRLNLNVGVQPGTFGLPKRTSVMFSLSNPLPAFDELLHGTNNVRGWGQENRGDATLLYARGFDPTTQSFRYEVNPRFGDTRPSSNVGRSPFRISVSVNVGFGPTPERQQLANELSRGRTRDGERMTAAQLRTRYIRSVAGPLPALMSAADSLGLTAGQRDSLLELAKRHAAAVDSIYTPLAEYLAGLGKEYDLGEAARRVESARDRATKQLLETTSAARAILTDEQFRQLPTFVQTQFDGRLVQRARRMGEAGRRFDR